MRLPRLLDPKYGPLGAIKLKHVWILALISTAYIIGRQGWPSPAIDDLIVKMTVVWYGTLLGLGIDATHFWRWKPSSQDQDYENRRRRAAFLIAGMLALALAV